MQKLYAFSLQHQLFCLAIIVSATLTSNSRVQEGKYLQLKYTVSMPEKNLDSLEQGPQRIGIGNDDVSIVCTPKYERLDDVKTENPEGTA